MSVIIPYDEDLYANEGAFISPGGDIIFTYGEHESFANDFCNGLEYSYSVKQDGGDTFHSIKISEEQLKLYHLWLEDYDFSRLYDLSDFLVLSLFFDKIETVIRREITTANKQPHVRFYNYYLMNWNVRCLTPMKYNTKTNQFEFDRREDWIVTDSEEREATEEIKKIKEKVLVKDRSLFFK